MKHDLNWFKGQDQGFTVEHRPVGKLVQQSLGETVQFGSSKPTQSPETIEDRSGKPVAQEIVVGVLQEEPSSSDRPGRPVSREEQHVQNHDSSGKPEREEAQHTVQENYHLKSRDNVDKFDLATDDGNIDFNISSIPEEAVKRSENFSILQLIRRITRHPQKQAVQNDLDKQQSFNAFSDESKSFIMDAGNVEISRDRQCGAEVAMQVLSHTLQYRRHILRMWTSDDERFGRESKVHLIHPRLILHTELLHQKRQTTWSQVWKITRM